jgi:hypothetical protein
MSTSMSMSMSMNHEPSRDTKQNLGGKLDLPADVSSLDLTATVTCMIIAGDVQDTDLRLRRARRCPPSGEKLKPKPRHAARRLKPHRKLASEKADDQKESHKRKCRSSNLIKPFGRRDGLACNGRSTPFLVCCPWKDALTSYKLQVTSYDALS